MSTTKHCNSAAVSTRSNSHNQIEMRRDIKQDRRASSPVRKATLFQKLFNMKLSEEEEDAENGRDRGEKRRHTVQVDKSMYYDRLTLAGDSDEAMMAKASADCLIDQPEKIFLTKPRPCSTNSSPNPRKSQRQLSSKTKRTSGTPEFNGNGVGNDLPPSCNNNNRKSSSDRPSTSRFQGRLQRGNRFANAGSGPGGTGFKGGSFKRRSMKMAHTASMTTAIKVDVTKPLSFPNTPETILEYHKRKPILDENEEWLVVELNEYECLVDGLGILKIIAKHSKFFEVEPDELWQEFFDFVDEIPYYDEVINFDIWQEFRDKKYAC